MDKTIITAKTIAVIIIIFAYKMATGIITPFIAFVANRLAMQQMNNAYHSNWGIEAYNFVVNHSGWFLALLIFIIFFKELCVLVTKLIDSVKENNHEKN